MSDSRRGDSGVAVPGTTGRVVGVTAFVVAIVGAYLAPMFRISLEVLRPASAPERTQNVTRLADQLPVRAYFSGFGDPSVSSEISETSQWLAVIILVVLIAGVAAVVRGQWLAALAAGTVGTALVVYNLFAIPIILGRTFDTGAGAAGGRVSLSVDPHPLGTGIVLVAVLLPVVISAVCYVRARRGHVLRAPIDVP